MAKKEEKPTTVIERSYNIPLRREWLKAPRWKRTKKAVKAAREFLEKHMKSDNVKLGKHLNDYFWKHGGKNPPHHVKVNATKDSEGKVVAEMEGAPKPKVKEGAPKKGVEKKVAEEEKKEEPKQEEKKEDKAEKKEEVKEKKPEPKNETPKPEPKKEEKKPEPKKDEEQKQVEELAQQILKKGSTK